MIRFRTRPAALLAAAAGTALALAVPAAAHAASPLASGPSQVVFDNGVTYSIATHHRYWSVVATTGSQGSDSDLLLSDAHGARLAASTTARDNSPITDWVAIDSNAGRRGPGDYLAEVARHPGSQPDRDEMKHLDQFVDGSRTLATGSPALAQPIGFPDADNWLVDVRDVRLVKGTTVTITVDGSISAVHLLGSTAGKPATYERTRTQTLASATAPDVEENAHATLTYKVTATGWYGVVFESLHWSGAGTVKVSVTP